MRTGAQYRSALADDRCVYVDGQKVHGVCGHDAFHGITDTVSSLYDASSDPSRGMIYTDPETGVTANKAFMIPRSRGDLQLRREAISVWARMTHGLVGRGPDHVGSFLRPRYLLEAREQFARKQLDAAGLRAVEDRAIAEVIRMQEEVGLQAITDGEFRRIDWFMDFKYAIGGIEKLTEKVKVPFRSAAGGTDFEFVAYRVGERMHLDDTIFAEDFAFLKSAATKAVPKLTIPSPSMLHSSFP